MGKETDDNKVEYVPIPRHRKNKSDLGPNYVAPDGGWGWLVCIAAGCSNLSTFAMLQQFGLIFRDTMSAIGLSNSQITTIININSCLTSSIGLFNGPLFRKFSYRTIAFVGAMTVVIAIFLTAFSNSFITFLLTFGVLYGMGIGINASANSLALNTYFKHKRRIATGFSWSITGLGPILMPYLITFLMNVYGFTGTGLILCGIATHAVLFSLLYHPVRYHVKSIPLPTNETDTEKGQIECCEFCHSKKDNQSIMSSQYLPIGDNYSINDVEMTDPLGTPMLASANDGWYSSRGSRFGSVLSLRPNKYSATDFSTGGNRSQIVSDYNSVIPSRKVSHSNLMAYERGSVAQSQKDSQTNLTVIGDNTMSPSRKISQTNMGLYQTQLSKKYKKRKTSISGNKIVEVPGEDHHQYDNPVPTIIMTQCDNLDVPMKMQQQEAVNYKENDVLTSASKKLEELVDGKDSRTVLKCSQCTCGNNILSVMVPTNENAKLLENESNLCKLDENENTKDSDKKLSLWEKIFIFFDLNLLRDLTFVNLMVGITVANFAELNFSILTPFILSEYNFSKTEIAFFMSCLAAMDIIVRLTVPFVATKLGWENKTFFLIGVTGMALGRIVIAHNQSYYVVLTVFCWIGLNKGLRTVFMALVLPSYVPLHRLPAASGIQLLFAGIFYFVVGPFVGWVRDNSNYAITMHFLNIATFSVLISWSILIFNEHRKLKLKTAELSNGV